MIPVLAATVWLVVVAMSLLGIEFQPRWEECFPSLGYLESLRNQLVSAARGVTPDSKALVLGLAVGERDLLSEQLAQQMKQLSLTHLVAVSGANLAIVAGAVYFLGAKLSLERNLRFCFAATSICVYVILVGPEPSVLRAFVMTMAVLIGLWMGRGSQPVVALSWAVLLILISDPSMGTNFGFALSASATLGLLLIGLPLYKKFESKLPKWLALGLATAVSAQIYTLPILLVLEPSIPAYAVLANLLVEPAVAPVTIIGLLSAILLPLSFYLSGLVSLFASLGTFWIELVAGAISEFPMVRLHWLPGWSGIFVAIIFAIVISLWSLGIRPRQSIFVGAISLALALSWISADVIRFTNWPGRNWSVVMCDVGQGDAFVLQSDGYVAVVDVGREDSPVDQCLDQLRVTHIDALFLSHFDLDHAGGIGGALQGRTVGRAFVTGFQDDRPVVQRVTSELAQKGIQLEIAQKNLQGKLGSVSWKVLSPSATANEAVDSNDASLVLRFDFEQFSVLLLGDLGERGQERVIRNALSDLIELSQRRLLLKVAHHGSADQSDKFHSLIAADLALVSVGKDNDYGHPTKRALQILQRSGASIMRSDFSGAVGIGFNGEQFEVFSAGKLAQ